MPVYIFKGANEYIKLDVKARDHIWIATSKTNYTFKDVSKTFYDTEQERKKCMQLSDDAFKIYLALQFSKQGYKLIQVQQ